MSKKREPLLDAIDGLIKKSPLPFDEILTKTSTTSPRLIASLRP